MAKFNTYHFHADSQDGKTIIDTEIVAISLESAWHKAITEAFEAVEAGTGDRPETIHLWRKAAASEHHG